MRKILEIGGGRTPYFIRYQIPCNEEDSYVSVDISDENTEYSKQELEKHKEQGNVCPRNVSLIISDASSLDLPDKSVDEVIISNTLSAPIHWNWDRDGDTLKIETAEGVKERPIPKTYYNNDPFYVERKNVIKEAQRVLKIGGVMSIYTDLIIYGVDSYYKIIEELKDHSMYFFQKDEQEESRIDKLNIRKLSSNEFCCCFRAEVLPKSEVYRFTKL